VDYGSLGSLALRDASVCWIKEQSRPTHSLSLSLSQQHLLKTGRKQPLKECCRRHTLLSPCEKKRLPCYTLSFSLRVLASWRKAARSGAKGDILVSAAALRAENCAKRIVCVYLLHPLSLSLSQRVKRLMKSTRETDLSWLPLSKLLPSATRLVGLVGWVGGGGGWLKGPD
jgi:hypothetical protein